VGGRVNRLRLAQGRAADVDQVAVACPLCMISAVPFVPSVPFVPFVG